LISGKLAQRQRQAKVFTGERRDLSGRKEQEKRRK
jgi:hypothetical protein